MVKNRWILSDSSVHQFSFFSNSFFRAIYTDQKLDFVSPFSLFFSRTFFILYEPAFYFLRTIFLPLSQGIGQTFLDFFQIFFAFTGIRLFSVFKGIRYSVFFRHFFLPFMRIRFFFSFASTIFLPLRGNRLLLLLFFYFLFCVDFLFLFMHLSVFVLSLLFIVFLKKKTKSTLLQDYRDSNVNIKITGTQMQMYKPKN